MECDQCFSNDVGVLDWDGVVHVWLGSLPTDFPRLSLGPEWNTSITKSQRSRAGIPSMRKPAAMRKMIAACVELCETEVCSLHIELLGTNVWLPKMQRIPADVDFDSSWSPAQSESWNNPGLHCCVMFPTWDCQYSHVWWMYEIKRAKRLWLHEQVCSQTMKCQVFQNEPNTDISEPFVNKLWTILLLNNYPLLNNDGHPCMVLRLCTIVESFYSHGTGPRVYCFYIRFPWSPCT